jgi:hypothetical protein
MTRALSMALNVMEQMRDESRVALVNFGDVVICMYKLNIDIKEYHGSWVRNMGMAGGLTDHDRQ